MVERWSFKPVTQVRFLHRAESLSLIGRALASEAKGYRFESCRDRRQTRPASLAVECVAVNHCDEGSNPSQAGSSGSLRVERPAHNGYDIGSNPIRSTKG